MDVTLQLTTAQAILLAQRLRHAQDAEAAFQQSLAWLTLGTPSEGLPLKNIDVETGVLTFVAPEP